MEKLISHSKDFTLSGTVGGGGWKGGWMDGLGGGLHENMQPVSQDVCFKMDPGTSQSLSLLLLCWRCPLQHHTSGRARTGARAHTHTHIHMSEHIHEGLTEAGEKKRFDVSVKPRFS